MIVSSNGLGCACSDNEVLKQVALAGLGDAAQCLKDAGYPGTQWSQYDQVASLFVRCGSVVSVDTKEAAAAWDSQHTTAANMAAGTVADPNFHPQVPQQQTATSSSPGPIDMGAAVPSALKSFVTGSTLITGVPNIAVVGGAIALVIAGIGLSKKQ